MLITSIRLQLVNKAFLFLTFTGIQKRIVRFRLMPEILVEHIER